MRLPTPSGSSLTLLALPGLVSSPSPSSSPSSPDPLLLPPFNARDSRLVASCALRAQQKQRRNQSSGGGDTRGGWSLWARLGIAPEEYGGQSPPLTDLPIRQVRYEHVHRRGALFCRTGSWLEFSGGGGEGQGPVKVHGTRSHSARLTAFEFLAVAFGLVSIRAVENQHFLCMDSRGQLYATPESEYSAECVFMEEMHPQVYNMYSSCAHGHPKRPWFLALAKNGHPKRGRNTRKGQKSAHFVLVEGGMASPVLDSLGHSQSRADWLVHSRNFYEVHQRRRKMPLKAKGRGGGRLKWEVQAGTKLVGGSRHRRRRRSRRA